MRKLKRSSSKPRKVLKRIDPPSPAIVSKKKGDIVEASFALFGNYLSWDDEIAPDNKPNPEQIAVKNDLYLKLSDDAKEVLNIIFTSPKEFVDACISNTNGDLRRKKGDKTHFIQSFFRKKWKSRLKVKRTFKELENFVRKLNSNM